VGHGGADGRGSPNMVFLVAAGFMLTTALAVALPGLMRR
jgi:hypothetical protein